MTVPDLDACTRSFLRALASPTRQRMVMLFSEKDELSVGEVSRLSGLSQSTASAHLAVLGDAGVLTSRRDGRTTWYRVDASSVLGAVDRLRDVLQCCCGPGEHKDADG